MIFFGIIQQNKKYIRGKFYVNSNMNASATGRYTKVNIEEFFEIINCRDLGGNVLCHNFLPKKSVF